MVPAPLQWLCPSVRLCSPMLGSLLPTSRAANRELDVGFAVTRHPEALPRTFVGLPALRRKTPRSCAVRHRSL